MNNIFSYLEEREQEFERHYTVAQMLETRMSETRVDDDLHIEVRHINTIKSGLIVHLYNIVEAVSTRTLKQVGEAVATEKPSLWTDMVLSEWVRAEFWNTEERLGENALNHLTDLSGRLVSGDKADAFIIKSAPGSWDDKAIRKVASKLGCELILSPEIRQAAYEQKYKNETSALKYLSLRRNDLAHGNTTFEEGANDLTLTEVKELSDRILPYLKAVTKSYEVFIEDKNFLKNEEEAA